MSFSQREKQVRKVAEEQGMRVTKSKKRVKPYCLEALPLTGAMAKFDRKKFGLKCFYLDELEAALGIEPPSE